ncbi:BAK_1a_G0033390.mRNA.1.CDS.1 [Saccharomyces cerevisiae]|nr:BAK_1a_G0033390.mRNA.1.CDS.1 [Saccharomyces cerevisiae]CAI4597431.1 BAI_1a_G0033340.mRNA.1.CDS.1 [Saccharomyces cerevisiae]CAI7208683.1 BAI_1a_G0033340.mRNA.1.CDS.1 [Saccharomyces cerevisiae]CAI7210577.1 BAK_1a_G0033390.mRNA.1.CDS.1 [Saccharomyces cerevisiae]
MSDDDYMNSDDDNDAEKRYVRPIFVRKRRREEDYVATSKDNIHHHPCDWSAKPSQRQNENEQKSTIRLVPVAMNTPKCQEKKKKRKGVGTTSHEATLFEYGESIAGYKCVTTESERDRLKRSDESESSSGSEVDVFAFDQAKGISTKVEAEERCARAVRQYWRMTKDEPATLPLPGTPTLTAVSLDMIDDKSVEQFYTMSSALMDANRLDLIRRDRIRWHPDKHRYHKSKVTKLFQAINGLWEQEKTEKR